MSRHTSHFVSVVIGVLRECGGMNTSVTHFKPFLTAFMVRALRGREAVLCLICQIVDLHAVC